MDANLPDEAQPLLDFAAAEALTRCLPETHVRALLAQARKASTTNQSELSVQIASKAIEEAQSISNPLLQAEGYSLLLNEASRQDQREGLANIQKQLHALLDRLIQQTRNAEIKQELLALQENVDKSL